MIEICGDLVWDLPCVQQASYLEGGPLMWMVPLYMHVNQKSDYDDDDIWYKRDLLWAEILYQTLNKGQMSHIIQKVGLNPLYTE